MVDEIIEIWRQEGEFIYFKDGNTINCAVNNLKLIDLAYALKHVDTMMVSWYSGLSGEQYMFVKTNSSYFRKIAKVLFRPRPRCNLCHEADPNKLSLCGKCKRIYYMYCCREHQVEDWVSHKSKCNKEMKDLKNRHGSMLDFVPEEEFYHGEGSLPEITFP